MDPFVIGCLANTELNPHHKNELACIETQRTFGMYGWLVLVTSHSLTCVQCS